MKPRCIAIVGATGTGKSRLAIALAVRLGGEIVNADALQVYRGLDIGTAKPTPEEQSRVHHHLLDILDPTETFSAGEFSRRARPLVDELIGRGRWPVVVGGSGLYLQALFDGLSEIPPVPSAVRRGLRERLRERGAAELFRELSELDPDTAVRLSPGDTQRLTRALEVLHSSGRSLSEWQREKPPREPVDVLRIGLTVPRALLYDRIASRARKMLTRGWLDEIRRLLDAGVPETAPAFQAIGYRQLLEHLGGETTLDQAMESTLRETRRYAKRQETWFRREKDTVWFSSSEPDLLTKHVMSFLMTKGVGG